MIKFSLPAVLFLALSAQAADAPAKWQYAGESQGITFRIKVFNACKAEGSKIVLKLESKLPEKVEVSFRLNDSEWSKTFTRELKAGATDSGLEFRPEEGSACHPFIDQIYVDSQAPVVSQSE
jgi:hypothetical protein